MSLIDVTTGEVIEVCDREQAEALVARCSAAIAHMNVRTGEAIEAMLDAYNAKAWIALGLGSWEELVEAKNWRWSPLTTSDRAAYGELLRTKGMSFRAIAATAGVSHQTIRRDLEGPMPSDIAPPVVQMDHGPELEPVPAEPAAPEPAPSVSHPEPEVEVETDDESTQRPLADVRKLTDLAGPTDQWRLRFDKATAAVMSLLTSYPVADVLQYADAEQVDDLDVLHQCFTSWVNDIRNGRPTGLRSIQGGRS